METKLKYIGFINLKCNNFEINKGDIVKLIDTGKKYFIIEKNDIKQICINSLRKDFIKHMENKNGNTK